MKRIFSVLLCTLIVGGSSLGFSACSGIFPDDEESSSVLSYRKSSADPENIADMESIRKLVDKSFTRQPDDELKSLPSKNMSLSDLLESTKIKDVIASDMRITNIFITAVEVSSEKGNKLVISQTLKEPFNQKTCAVARTYLEENLKRDRAELNSCLYADAVSELIDGNPEIILCYRWYNTDGSLFAQGEFSSKDLERVIAEQSSEQTSEQQSFE